MRYWSLLLHFYQPPTQERALTQHILEACYLPVTELLLAHPHAKVTCNISGSLILELEAINAGPFFDNVKELVQRGQIELTNSPLYHPVIPLSPMGAIHRQLRYNSETVAFFFKTNRLAGLFPPELAMTTDALHTLAPDYSWCMIDESSVTPDYNLHIIPHEALARFDNLNVVVSSRALVEIIRSYPSQINSTALISFIEQNTAEDTIIFSAHDVEVFGHHYEERIHLFEELITSDQLTFLTVSEGIERMHDRARVLENITSSSWQTTTQDLQQNNPFPMWYAPSNRLQQLYDQLAKRSFEALSSIPRPKEDAGLVYSFAEKHYDQGISSCYPYWLSNQPWWHPEFVEAGAQNLIKTIRALPVDKTVKLEGEKLYIELIQNMWQLHWSGQVEENFAQYEKQRQQALARLPDVS